jgi:Fuc2NAc and GlcNAc transferase
MAPLGVAIISMALGLSGALLIAKNGIAWGLADIPNERSSHTSIVPRGGGLGISLAVALAGLLIAPSLLFVIGPSLLIATAAFFNDKREFFPGIRLAVETIAAGVAVYQVFVMTQVPGTRSDAFLVLVFSTLYIVAQANIFNFMDGIDGIAAIEAIVSFLLLAIYAQLRGSPDMALISIAVAGSAIGFMPINIPHARVFMGDVGSVFIGFLFGTMIVLMARSVAEFLALALFQGVFSIDGAITIVRRAMMGQNIFQAHRQHLYQLLVHSCGWSHAKTE